MTGVSDTLHDERRGCGRLPFEPMAKFNPHRWICGWGTDAYRVRASFLAGGGQS